MSRHLSISKCTSQNRRIVPALILFASAFSVKVPAESSPAIAEVVGKFGGVCRAQAVQGNIAYIGIGSNLVVLDRSNSSTPTEVARVSLDETVTDIVVEGVYALVSTHGVDLPAWTGGKTIAFDISDPHNPTTLGVFETKFHVKSVEIWDTFGVLVAVDRLLILELDAPGGARIVKEQALAHSGMDAVIQGDLLLLVGYNHGIDILDLAGLPNLRLISTYPTNGYPKVIAVDGNRVALADGDVVEIIDITSPQAPSLMGTVQIYDVVRGVALSENKLYVGDAYDVSSIDITNPQVPVTLDSLYLYDSRGAGYSQLAIQGDELFLCGYEMGFVTVDISNPSTLAISSSFEPSISALSVAVKNNLACVGTATRGLDLINVSEPGNPALLSHYGSNFRSLDMEWHNGRFYEANQRGLRVAGVASGQFTGVFQVSQLYTAELELNGNRAYLCSQPSFRIIDAPELGAPTDLGRIALSEVAYSLAVTRAHAYITQSSSTSSIIDIADATNPQRIGEILPVLQTSFLAATGNRLFVAGFNDRSLREASLENPAAPQVISQTTILRVVRHISIFGNLLFVSTEEGGLDLFDIRQPGAPQLFGHYDHIAYDVAFENGRFYLAGGDRGLDIVQFSGSLPAVPAPTRLHASDGDPVDRVWLTWDRMGGAEQYDLWREKAGSNNAVHIGSTINTEYYDVPNTTDTYTYWVTATYAGDVSALSTPETGYITDAYYPPTLGVSPATKTVPVDAGEAEFAVNNSGEDSLTWTAQVISAPWVQIEEGGSGQAPGTIRVSYTLNGSHIERTATIRVSSPEAINSPFDIVLVQEPTKAELSVEPASRTLLHLMSAATFEVSNLGTGLMPWTVELVSGDWLAIGTPFGFNDGPLDVSASANYTGVKREAQFRVIAPNSPQHSVLLNVSQLPKGTIVVDEPSAGDRWRRGKKQKIAWTFTESTGGRVRIELLRNGTIAQTITQETENDGKFRWQVPGKANVDSSYQIRVVSLFDQSIQDQSGEFEIRDRRN